MINAFAGVLIGWLAPSWFERLFMPFMWGFVACFYHMMFSKMERMLFVEELRRGGTRRSRAQIIYYLYKYRRGLLRSLAASVLVGVLIAPWWR